MSCRAALVNRRQGARQARICPRGLLVGRCSASSASRFPRTSLRVRGFADAGGVVDFGGKRAARGTFGCSACDVCFMRSANFSAGTEFDEAEAHSARFASIAASCTRACASSSWETVPAGLPLRRRAKLRAEAAVDIQARTRTSATPPKPYPPRWHHRGRRARRRGCRASTADGQTR